MKKLLGLLAALLILGQAACAVEAPVKPAHTKITAEEAKAILDGGEPYILLDVRTVEEFEDKRIDGAILIPDYELADRAEAELPDKEALILIYCRSGRRSANAAKELAGLGYSNALDFGGIIDWPYATVSGREHAEQRMRETESLTQ